MFSKATPDLSLDVGTGMHLFKMGRLDREKIYSI